MSDRFIPLNCDDDVLSFFDQTFKLADFKKRVIQEYNNKINQYSHNEHLGLFGFSVQSVPIQASNIKWQSTIINCEILRLGCKSWQSGKLRIEIALESVDMTSVSSHGRHTRRQITKKIEIQEICLEFCPNELEINSPESPLDDIRQIVNGNN